MQHFTHFGPVFLELFFSDTRNSKQRLRIGILDFRYFRQFGIGKNGIGRNRIAFGQSLADGTQMRKTANVFSSNTCL